MDTHWDDDYYEFMGLKRNCSEDDIAKAYKKLAVKFHPDKSKIPEARKKYKNMLT
jgi:DnaJ-class molecular chaperone